MPKKQQIPALAMAGNSRRAPKVLGSLFLLGVFAVIVKYPGEAAGWGSAVANGLSAAIDNVVAFISALER
ncbi:hypothetical protein [Saccharomonospora azurea]|uniref:Uncharacterized protein n=1 Tax=Saccharomonospora azurea NA-128 TaxID=882081 RepID=H8GFG0_9PSEU|nr:hypothetical protein [Saccharomonospora azurea]EHY90022.1 hypothetical protein SacazDRAFT_03141 [Saccharomonospora azurea NA-128]